MIVIIKELVNNSCELLSVPENLTACEAVEFWQKDTIHYRCHGNLPPVRWKVSEHDDMVNAMIESAHF